MVDEMNYITYMVTYVICQQYLLTNAVLMELDEGARVASCHLWRSWFWPGATL